MEENQKSLGKNTKLAGTSVLQQVISVTRVPCVVLVTQLRHFTVDEPSAHCRGAVEQGGGGGVALPGERRRTDAPGQGVVGQVQG